MLIGTQSLGVTNVHFVIRGRGLDHLWEVKKSMSAEDGFISHKETLLKLREPYKIKIVPFSKGIKIELTLNGDEYLADKMKEESGPIRAMIKEAISIIEGPLGSKLIRDEKE